MTLRLAALGWGALVPIWAAVDFSTEVRPVLEKHCHGCHGAKTAMHGLRLDVRAAAYKGGESGVPAVVPGKSAESLLYRYVAGLDKAVKMPPAGPGLSEGEKKLLARWIDEGAEWPADGQEVADPKFVKGRTHWAFQPRQAIIAVPAVRNRQWVRNPIDAFVLARLEQKGWQPSPAASRAQLLRRAWLDLTGLPPTLREQSTAASVDSAVDELLQRPAYAERWARHWLDVVRYGESNGYERDGHKPQVWKFRDYAIQSLDRDKPFNQFLIEQLAGDEIDEPTAETLIATGYHRLGPWDDEPADPATDRFDQLDDMLATTSQAFLGLTLACARCHNHKFEPLTAADYYSMTGILQGLERPRKGRTELDRPIGTRLDIERERARDALIQPLAAAIAKLEEPFRTKEKNWAETIPADVSWKIAEIQTQIAGLERETPNLPRGYFMEEPKADAGPAHVLLRGKPGALGPEVAPAVPGILAAKPVPFLPPGRTSRRRLSLARWIASDENPLTARVIVNRVWMWHFGEGLVRTPSDFGLMGQRPTHPELLDWLANWFVDNGWSLKKLHKLILSSNTWRMSKRAVPGYVAEDPENRLLWRVPYKRLEAEAIRDSVLAVSGRLNPTMYGPSVFPAVQPQALEGSSDPDKIWKASSEEDASRRSIYVFVKRSLILPMLEMLDLCDTARSSAQRLTTSVPTQALTLFNGDFVNQQARYLAARLRAEAGSGREAQIALAYRLAFARAPDAGELRETMAFLEKEEALAKPGDPGNAPLRALEQLGRVIFNMNEFVYVD